MKFNKKDKKEERQKFNLPKGIMKTFIKEWEEIHNNMEWGKYPSENVIRFIARNYYNEDRGRIKILDFGCGGGKHMVFGQRRI